MTVVLFVWASRWMSGSRSRQTLFGHRLIPSDFHPNYGYESLAYDSVRHLLWSISESTLRNDGEPASWQNGEANRLRLFAFDWSELSDTSSMFGSVRHPIAVSYAYRMDAPAIRKRPQTYAMGVS